jgi:hypothetical protein
MSQRSIFSHIRPELKAPVTRKHKLQGLESASGRLDPFAEPSVNGRYLRLRGQREKVSLGQPPSRRRNETDGMFHRPFGTEEGPECGLSVLIVKSPQFERSVQAMAFVFDWPSSCRASRHSPATQRRHRRGRRSHGVSACSSSPAPSTASKPASRGAARGR